MDTNEIIKLFPQIGIEKIGIEILDIALIAFIFYKLLTLIKGTRAMEIFKGYSFPGNVRELENIIERAIILEKKDLISAESLPQSIKMFHIETVEPSRIKTIEKLNRDYAEKVLAFVGGNKSKAAELLGISRTSLWRILKEE